MPPLLDKVQVAQLLRISVRSVDRLRSDRHLAAVRVRSRIRFLLDDVQAYVKTHQQER
jgi:excisionase family DNA binding protein